MDYQQILFSTVKTKDQGVELINKLLDVAKPTSVFGQPVTQGDFTVITASEVTAGVGFGFGMGGGSGSETSKGQAVTPTEAETPEPQAGVGGGGGGGGSSMARPVAVITISPEGVRVEPVMDPTKLGIALLTTFGAMLMLLGRMRRGGR